MLKRLCLFQQVAFFIEVECNPKILKNILSRISAGTFDNTLSILTQRPECLSSTVAFHAMALNNVLT